jgi:hypothetical protein
MVGGHRFGCLPNYLGANTCPIKTMPVPSLLIVCFLALAASGAYAQNKPAENPAKPNSTTAEAPVASKTPTTGPTEKKIVFTLKEQKETEYTCIFTKGVSYQLNLIVPDMATSKLSLKIFDSQRKELSSKTCNLKTEIHPTLNFNCLTTGMYFLKVTPL